MKLNIHDVALAAIVFVVGAGTQLIAGGLSVNHTAITMAISAGISAVLHKFYPKG